MEYKTVILEKKDGIAVLTLNRPDVLNSVNMEMRSEVTGILDVLEVDPHVRLLIVTGAGRAFCSGADIREAVHNPDMAKLVNKKKESSGEGFAG